MLSKAEQLMEHKLWLVLLLAFALLILFATARMVYQPVPQQPAPQPASPAQPQQVSLSFSSPVIQATLT